MTRHSDETIYEHFLLIADEVQPFSIRRASKTIQDRYSILVGEDRLRRIIQTFGRMKKKSLQYDPADFSWADRFAEDFALEYHLAPKRVHAVIDSVASWVIETTPPKKLFPWH